MDSEKVAENAGDVKGVFDDPIIRLVDAMRAEGETDDVRAGCVVLRAYPWSDVSYVVDLLMRDEAAPLPSGWRRGMFSGRQAEEVVRAARRAHDRATR